MMPGIGISRNREREPRHLAGGPLERPYHVKGACPWQMQKLTEIQTQRQHLCTEEQCPHVSASLEVSARKISSYRGALAGLGGKAMKSRTSELSAAGGSRITVCTV